MEDTQRRADFLRQTALLAAVGDPALDAFADAFEELRLAGGASLQCLGRERESLYVVVRGRVRVELEGADGPIRLELHRGDFFGELSLMSEDGHSASVFAVRDSELLTLSHESFKEVATAWPQALWAITRVVISRIGRLLRGENQHHDSPVVNLTYVPLGDDPQQKAMAQDLARGLGSICTTLHLDADLFCSRLGEEAMAIPWDDPRNGPIIEWLEEQERVHRFVLYEAHSELDPWTFRCLRQADRLLLVAPAGAAADIDAIKRRFLMPDRCAISEVKVDVLVYHPADAVLPCSGGDWRDITGVQRVYHARAGHRGDFERVARCLTNRAVGLVLGGGGARGIAQIGALRALEEAGVPIDLLGGTSVGSIFAATYAMGWDAERILEFTRSLFRRRSAIVDFTFPYLSLLSGAKLSQMLRELFGDARIENLWREYYCISVSLNAAATEIHDRGELWRHVRSSCALPGIFPPVHTGQQVLIDGGVLNNLPTDVMFQRCGGSAGTLIAIDVSGSGDDTGAPFDTQVSGWGALSRRLNPFSEHEPTLNIFDVLLSSTVITSRLKRNRRQYAEHCDLYLRPPVDQFGLLQFDALEDLYRIGYEHTRDVLKDWSLPGSGSA